MSEVPLYMPARPPCMHPHTGYEVPVSVCDANSKKLQGLLEIQETQRPMVLR